MLVKISCSRDEVPTITEFYAEQGFTLQKKLSLGNEVDLWFSCADSYEGYRAISDFGAQGFLEFQDGSVSPLYVRRSPNFDD